MANFVLVAGARLGAWAWDEVVPRLRAAGHGAHPLTLSGLAERRGVPVGRRTHVEDVVAAVSGAGLREVVLVGHSYAGIPVGQAAGALGGRLAHVVFVDADLPVEGASFLDAWPEERAGVEAALAAHGGWWPGPGPEHYAGEDLTDARIARIVAAATPHPGVSLTEPATLPRRLSTLPATYVTCAPESDGAPGSVVSAEPDPGLPRGPLWRHVRMATGHWPMFSRPEELADVLLSVVSDPDGPRSGAVQAGVTNPDS
ncbi:alpha/beta fold hydrolase (plasmid) [Streptomyces sp. BI20]|uniref:alpha/beta fold hydrolase n=1 Tax=Streptomyces sp. BI20 TaxID=3403460 RepID=UPI003C762EA3